MTVNLTDGYLERFPEEHRSSVERAYEDGYLDAIEDKQDESPLLSPAEAQLAGRFIRMLLAGTAPPLYAQDYRMALAKLADKLAIME